MTEKRFTLKAYDWITCDIFDWKIEIANVHRDDAQGLCDLLNELHEENEQLKQQISELKEDVPLLLTFYRWYPFAVEKKEHQAYNRLWDFVND